MNIRKHLSNKRLLLWLILLTAIIWYLFFALPSKLFNDPLSTVVFDSSEQMIAARLATDEQWRFAESDSIPYKFEECILNFEDEYFFYHPGFNPFSLFKAFWINLKSGAVKRGGSTISMQTIRLSRKGKSRTIYQKVVELILATRMELSHSKAEILKIYASNTPFGGNIVGLDAAAWRYYGRSAHQLSWAESATLAVLPNAPALIHPGRNRDQLRSKRDRLLDKLWGNAIIDSTTCYLAKQEPIPEQPKPLPKMAPHLLNRSIADGHAGQNIITSIDANIQSQCIDIIASHSKVLKSNHIHNVACLVLEVKTGKVLAYVGNTPKENENHGQDVDIVTSQRSTGSILKPFLYASALQDGTLLPDMLLADIPTQIAGYSPQNYNKTYDGAVPARRALARSLNVPAVRLLKEYKYERFHSKLKSLGLSNLNQPADHYGLSIILGGSEASLWELCGIYASLARVLINYEANSSQYFKADMHMPYYSGQVPKGSDYCPIDAGSLWLMFNAMEEVNKPSQEFGWQFFNSSQNIGWKTGTSFGNRDAWAIGTSTDYVVGIWVGNADGEGRAELTGINSAAPIMFDVFKLFRTHTWFNTPYDALKKVEVCKQSGYLASHICNDVDTIWAQANGTRSGICPYHKTVHLDKEGLFQVNSSCADPSDMQHKSWFVLPPVMEWYYKSKNANYKRLPPFSKDCMGTSENNMEIIYPKSLSKIFIPKEISGELGQVIFEVAHRNRSTSIFWHIDNEYIGQTTSFNEMAVQPEVGKHKLSLVDENGETLVKWFTIVE